MIRCFAWQQGNVMLTFNCAETGGPIDVDPQQVQSVLPQNFYRVPGMDQPTAVIKMRDGRTFTVHDHRRDAWTRIAREQGVRF